MPGQHFSLAVKQLVVEAWYACGKPAEEAGWAPVVAKFRELLGQLPPEVKRPCNPSEYVHTWLPGYISHGSLEHGVGRN